MKEKIVTKSKKYSKIAWPILHKPLTGAGLKLSFCGNREYAREIWHID